MTRIKFCYGEIIRLQRKLRFPRIRLSEIVISKLQSKTEFFKNFESKSPIGWKNLPPTFSDKPKSSEKPSIGACVNKLNKKINK